MWNTLCLATTALLLLALPCFATASTTKSGPEEIPSDTRFNFFDSELLQAVINAQSGNVLVSPVSVKAILAMILEGAGGVSGEEIRTALRLPENQEATRTLFTKYLTSVMEPTPGIKLEMASRVFMAKHLQASQTYAINLRQYYAELHKVDFATPDITARIINDWVKQVTKGLIPKLVEAGNLQPDTQTVLTNAVYFKGRWKVPFDQEVTKVQCFYTAPGVCQNTNMMETLEFFNFNYIRELDADALELPYQGNKYSMLLVAPKEIDGMTQLKKDILHFPVHSIVASMETAEVLVSLPRFEIDFSIDLVPTLHRLGVREIFGPNSNLTGMFARSEVSAQVSNVFHKAKIIVNEAGSESAAGTGALVIPLMGSAISKFRADRPFLFFIRDMTTGTVLFAGRVSVPEIASSQYQKPKPPTSTPSAGDLDGIFSVPHVSTLRPSQSNSGGGSQGYRPSITTTRRPNRPPLHHGSQAAATSTTEGMEIISFSGQNSPTIQNSENSNVNYPSESQNRKSPFSPSSQHAIPLNNNPKYEAVNTQHFNSPNPSTSTNSNAQTSFSFPNPNVQYSRSAYPQQNSFKVPEQQITISHTALRPELNRPIVQYQSSGVTQTNSQNPSPSYTQYSSLPNTQFIPNYQNTDQQSNGRVGSHQNPQFESNPRNSGFESQNSFPNRPLYNREIQQHANTKQLGDSQFPSQYSHYPIPGNTAEYLTNNREYLQQASSERSPTYMVLVRNENPLQAPTYQQPQSQDRDAIQFAQRTV